MYIVVYSSSTKISRQGETQVKRSDGKYYAPYNEKKQVVSLPSGSFDTMYLSIFRKKLLLRRKKILKTLKTRIISHWKSAKNLKDQ